MKTKVDIGNRLRESSRSESVHTPPMVGSVQANVYTGQKKQPTEQEKKKGTWPPRDNTLLSLLLLLTLCLWIFSFHFIFFRGGGGPWRKDCTTADERTKAEMTRRDSADQKRLRLVIRRWLQRREKKPLSFSALRLPACPTSIFVPKDSKMVFFRFSEDAPAAPFFAIDLKVAKTFIFLHVACKHWVSNGRPVLIIE